MARNGTGDFSGDFEWRPDTNGVYEAVAPPSQMWVNKSGRDFQFKQFGEIVYQYEWANGGVVWNTTKLRDIKVEYAPDFVPETRIAKEQPMEHQREPAPVLRLSKEAARAIADLPPDSVMIDALHAQLERERAVSEMLQPVDLTQMDDADSKAVLSIMRGDATEPTGEVWKAEKPKRKREEKPFCLFEDGWRPKKVDTGHW